MNKEYLCFKISIYWFHIRKCICKVYKKKLTIIHRILLKFKIKSKDTDVTFSIKCLKLPFVYLSTLVVGKCFINLFFLYSWASQSSSECICSSSSSSFGVCCWFVVVFSCTSNDFKKRVQNRFIGAMVWAWRDVNWKLKTKYKKKKR